MTIKSIVLLALILTSVGWFSFRFSQLIRILKLGNSEDRFDSPVKRFFGVIINAFAQKSVVKEPSGFGHFFIFMGFFVIQIGAIELFVQGFKADFRYDTFSNFLFGTPFIGGLVYIMIDVVCVIVLLVMTIALIRRFILKPVRLQTRDSHAHVDATVIISLIALIILTLYGINGAELSTKQPGDELFSFMPVSSIFAGLFSGTDHATAHLVREILWWIHVIIILGFLVYIPYSKHLHLLGSFPNIFFRNLGENGTLSKMDLEDEEAESFGVGAIETFTWKQLLDTYACTECGRCQENCPAHLTEKPLSPKEIIHSMKLHLLEKGPIMIGDEKKAEGEEAQKVMNTALIGDVITEDEIWSCTNCLNCQEHCPVFNEHVQAITDMRRYLVLTEGKMPTELQTTFNNVEVNSNPYGFAFASRGDWLPEESGVKTLSEDKDVDVLYFVGCAASFDSRNQKIATSVLNVMKKAGLKVGILGAEEGCCGDSFLRLGNDYLFQTLVAQNIEIFNQYGVKKIVTSCPHCYNVLKKEYPKYGGTYEVEHYIETVSQLIDNGKLTLKNPVSEKFTYHDSCFLGRYNQLYAEPRKILKAVPGVELAEASKHHSKSICCGGGGGRMWMEEHLGSRINQLRTKQLESSGANKVATACPYCMTMFSDGVCELGREGEIEVIDIIEIVEKSIG